MAKKVETVVTWTDDLDAASKANETIPFSYRGVNYTIDLSKKNAAAFDRALQTYIEHARKDRGGAKATRRGAATSPSGRTRKDLDAIRAWANENGHTVAERGRIANAIVAAFDAAH